MSEPVWYPGDRVEVVLPDFDAVRRPGGAPRMVTVSGTVTAVRPGGARVELDREVNGVSNCFATHGELTRIE